MHGCKDVLLASGLQQRGSSIDRGSCDLRFNRDFTRIYFFEMHYMKCWNYVIEKKFFLENKKDDIQDGMNYQIKGLQKPY